MLTAYDGDGCECAVSAEASAAPAARSPKREGVNVKINRIKEEVISSDESDAPSARAPKRARTGDRAGRWPSKYRAEYWERFQPERIRNLTPLEDAKDVPGLVALCDDQLPRITDKTKPEHAALKPEAFESYVRSALHTMDSQEVVNLKKDFMYPTDTEKQKTKSKELAAKVMDRYITPDGKTDVPEIVLNVYSPELEELPSSFTVDEPQS